jgi:hypothetical protein
MSKSNGSRFIIVLITSILILFGVAEGLADNIAPEVQTQINKRTDLFQKSINNLPSVEKSLEDKKQATINAMGDGKTNTPQGLPSITKKSKGELENESGKLESIHENDLDSRGREEMLKKNVINELYPDYSKPLNKQYMKDAKDLAEGQNKLMANLFAKLKKVGVDCKTIKGDKKHEPEYFLKIRATHYKDTIYNQTFCEELRNKYNCRDSLTLRCSKKGIAFGSWQNRTMVMTFVTIPERWWTVDRWENSYCACGRWRINPAYNQEIAIHIAGTIGAKLDQVYVGHQNIVVIPRPNLSTNVDWSDCHEKWGEFYSDQRWAKVTFHYQYKPNYEICEQWSEDWNERCGLQ